MVLKNARGQTVVEYILLLAVSVAIVTTFYRSQAFQRLFGDGGQVGRKIKLESEFSYRHAYMTKAPDEFPREEKDASRHPSYHDVVNGDTRFFGPKEPYGQ